MKSTRTSLQKNLLNSSVVILLLAAVIGIQSTWGQQATDKIDKSPVVTPPVAIRSITGERTRAVDINNRGVVIGTYGGPFSMARSFTWMAKKGFLDIGEFTATAINNCGDIAAVINLAAPGVPVNPTLPTSAIVIRGGQIVDLGKLDPSSPTSWAYATGINDAGHVSGMAGDFIDGSITPFLWTPETGMRRLDGPQFHSGAAALNNLDQVAGFKQVEEFNGLQRPALWSPGQPVQLVGGLGGRYGSAEAINDRAQVVGNSQTDQLVSPLHAGFFWSESTGGVALQPYEGQQFDVASHAYDINLHGTIVGDITVARDPGITEPHAALWTSPSDFLIFSDVASEAVAINDRGQIVGNVYNNDLNLDSAVMWELKKLSPVHPHVCGNKKIVDGE